MAVSFANISAVVLAGGFGRRVQHLLPDLPKPMAPVCGRPFLEWVIRYLARQGLRSVVLSLGHMGEKIEAHFAAVPAPDLDLVCIRENEPLGTAGGFLHAARTSGRNPSAWLVLNGDSLAFASLTEVLAALDAPDNAGALVGVDVEDAARFGTIGFDQAGLLKRFEEKRPGRGVINAGMYLFRATTLNAFPAKLPLSFEQEVFPALLQAGAALKVCVSRAPFLDIGTPESLPQAESFIRDNRNQFA